MPNRHIIYLYAQRISVALCLLFAFAGVSKAQTIVANRVKAAAAALPDGCRTVAKYTDNQRHCLYYTSNERMYKYDVLTDRKAEVRFSSGAYSRIINTCITEEGRYLFVWVDKDLTPKTPPENIQELWRIDTFSNRYKRIGAGFAVEKHKNCFIIKALSARNEQSPAGRKAQWKARDHYFLLDGRPLSPKEEYTISK